MFGSAKKLPRLLQWNGRKRSTRQEEPFFRRLGHRRVMARLVVVWTTTMLVTALAIWWGPPMPYRLGECYPHELRARVDFDVVHGAENSNLEHVPRSTLLVPRCHPVEQHHLETLRQEHRAFVRQATLFERWSRGVSLFLIFSLLTALVAIYVARFQLALANRVKMIGGVCVLVLLTIGLGTALNQAPWHAAALPLTFTAMVLTLAYNPQFALLMSFTLALTLTMLHGISVEHLLENMGALSTAILLLRNIRTRTQLVQVSTASGMVFFAMTLATGLLTGQASWLIFTDAFRNLLWGSLAGFLLTGMLPLVELCFGIVTDIRLLELADGSHPLMQELVRRAPGTYTHSMTVATLAETAAEAIGANPLLVRVGSYFHDVGKMLKPQYFVENQTGENRHDQLEPALSTLIIIGHVKDGIALAQQYQLPKPIVDFISQHHGTTLVEYFYREAMRQQESMGQPNNDLEACFRYPGPRPQNRENGILMLADAVESTSRSLSQPTPASLGKLVHDIVMKRLLDGQFEESGLTLTELRVIEESLCKSVIALFHARIKYPEMDSGTFKKAG